MWWCGAPFTHSFRHVFLACSLRVTEVKVHSHLGWDPWHYTTNEQFIESCQQELASTRWQQQKLLANMADAGVGSLLFCRGGRLYDPTLWGDVMTQCLSVSTQKEAHRGAFVAAVSVCKGAATKWFRNTLRMSSTQNNQKICRYGTAPRSWTEFSAMAECDH